MNEYDKPPPYSPEAPPTTQQPTMGGYQGGTGVPPTSFNAYSGVPPASTGTYSGVPPGYQVVNPAVMPAYGSTVYIQQPPISPQVVLVGGCPACRVGVLEEDFTCLGVCLAIFFFPLGILCCLAMMQRRCPNCGAVFS